MTPEEFRKIDDRVAVEVMGWERLPVEGPRLYPRWRGTMYSVDAWHPTTDIAQAMDEVVKEMQKQDCDMDLWDYADATQGDRELGRWGCQFNSSANAEFAPTAPLAICLAALEAKKEKTDG